MNGKKKNNKKNKTVKHDLLFKCRLNNPDRSKFLTSLFILMGVAYLVIRGHFNCLQIRKLSVSKICFHGNIRKKFTGTFESFVSNPQGRALEEAFPLDF